MEREELDTLIGTLGEVDHRTVDWKTVRWTAYLIHQHMRYEYPARIHDLYQRLVIIPPGQHGGQRLVTHHLEISSPEVELREERDEWGNLVVNLYVEHVDRAIDFTAWIVIEKEAAAGPIRVSRETYDDPALREPSRLTAPDDALRAAARELAAPGGSELALGARVNAWVHGQMEYEWGKTGVRTTASQAYALRRGVCQDYAHVMLALLRQCGVPARYVSGHLLGEGGTHAWVEVLLPDPERPGAYLAHAFDPTHNSEPAQIHITVAAGRDYGDVAPTSGTFRAPHNGHLSARKRAGVTAVEYFAPTT